MTGDVNMNNNKIFSLPTPTARDQPATKSYAGNNLLKTDGRTAMTGNLNFGSHRIIHVADPNGKGVAATKNTPKIWLALQ